MDMKGYTATIGLEIHAHLKTKTKMFSRSLNNPDETQPNINISPVDVAHPGTLPTINKKALEHMVRIGLAVNGEIANYTEFDRKNYFYPDLPKGYQTSQFDLPIVGRGDIEIEVDGIKKVIGITRIHMEEDAGKSTHDLDPYNTLIDLNRAGVPLIEIVSEPDMRSAEEAYQYLIEVRKLLRYLEICDGNMEEGSMRCDANISVRLFGAPEFGERCEVKNMNSMRNVMRAIDYEVKRQIDFIEEGGRIDQQTRSFNAGDGSTFALRSKENANDYRYFPEPDLPPFIVTENKVNEIPQVFEVSVASGEMISFERCLAFLFKTGKITREVALDSAIDKDRLLSLMEHQQ